MICTQAHIQLQYTKHLANFKLLFLKVVFCTRVGLQQLEKYNSAMISASIFYFYFYQGNKIIWYIKIQTSWNRSYPLLFFLFEKAELVREEDFRAIYPTQCAHILRSCFRMIPAACIKAACTSTQQLGGSWEAKNSLSSPCTPITRNSSCVASSELTSLSGDLGTTPRLLLRGSTNNYPW